MQIKDVTRYLETIAPPFLQESYDNCRLLTGSPNQEVTGILVTLDCTEAVVQEAYENNCNLIIAHHPILFKPLKKITGSNYVERTLIEAIRNNIAIYAVHTNLDNVLPGVNRKLGESIGLKNLRILSPRKDSLRKLVTFIPHEHAEKVLQALHEAGAGQIGNYKNCSFRLEGTGTFMPTAEASPFIGQTDKLEYVREIRAEVIFPAWLEEQVMQALKESHPYEEVAYYLTPLTNANQEAGSGMIGETEKPMDEMEFLLHLKKSLGLTVIRHTRLTGKAVKTVAVCGGSGSFLLPEAIRAGAQVYVSADFKYHEFFDADNRIIIADIGHYESETRTRELLAAFLSKKFPTFAVRISATNTNPISYIT
ncbi:MAG: Nif3-like dinuclear metal center hexameric protein [Cyclobacteriaceae bacterium]|nr:Nif3-like dinuclear metal center hexameric protein [Cyclobacteriaceae bacterium]